MVVVVVVVVVVVAEDDPESPKGQIAAWLTILKPLNSKPFTEKIYFPTEKVCHTYPAEGVGWGGGRLGGGGIRRFLSRSLAAH